jgi:hypothetical protein
VRIFWYSAPSISLMKAHASSGCGPFFTRAMPEGMAMTPSFGAPISTAAPCRLRSAA